MSAVCFGLMSFLRAWTGSSVARTGGTWTAVAPSGMPHRCNNCGAKASSADLHGFLGGMNPQLSGFGNTSRRLIAVAAAQHHREGPPAGDSPEGPQAGLASCFTSLKGCCNMALAWWRCQPFSTHSVGLMESQRTASGRITFSTQCRTCGMALTASAAHGIHLI